MQKQWSSILNYSGELWVTTEKVRSQVQAIEISFLRSIEGVTLGV